MITLKDLRMQQTVKAAVEYIESGARFIDLRQRFNLLCEYFHADEYDPDELSLRVADPLSRRHILAQRVVIESIHDLKTEEQLRRLDRLMDQLATNPRLEKEYIV